MMLLQTNSYIVPRDKRAEHARLLRRFRQVLARLGCDHFEVYEQVGANWNSSGGDATGRVVQIMKFRDRRHQLAVQAAERNDPVAQAVIAEFCELINFPYQQQRGLFAVGFYNAVLPVTPARGHELEAHPAHDGHEGHPSAETHAAEAPASHEPEPAAAPHQPLDARPDDILNPFATGAAGVVAAGAAAADALGEGALSEPVVVTEAGPNAAPVAELPSEASVEPDAGHDAAPAAEAALVDDAAADVRSADEPAADETVALDEEHETDSDHPAQPGASGEADDEAGPAEGLAEEEMDLAALLDPHLDHHDGSQPPPLPQAGGNGAHVGAHAPSHPGHRPEDDLSLEGLLDDEASHTTPEIRQNVTHGASH